MSDTVLARPVVKQYLRALDAACASLPAAQARELHELIAAGSASTRSRCWSASAGSPGPRTSRCKTPSC
jgi:hypothetical protein